MIFRHDQITVKFPETTSPDAKAAAAVQELLGGKFGEMSTLMNYTFQSFNFRGRSKVRPFYDLISNIAAEEYSHIEAVSYAINLLLSGTTTQADRNKPSKNEQGRRYRQEPRHQRQGRSRPAQGRGGISASLRIFSTAARRRCRWTRWAGSGRVRTCFPAAT